jgi:hypothetical protein
METVRKVQLQLLLEGYSYRSAKKAVNKLLSICMNIFLNFRKRLAIICYCANWQPNFKNIDGKFVFVAKFVYFAL